MYYNQQTNTVRRIVAGVVVVAAIGFVIVVAGYVRSAAVPSADEALVSAPVSSIELLTPEAALPALPARISIPAIDVDTAVQYVGLDPDGTGDMDVPSNFTDVGWYKHGVRPGMPGSAVIAGHVSGKDIPEAVFYNLHTLVVGDEVVVTRTDGMTDTYRVVGSKVYAHDDPTAEVFVSTDANAKLNLITCGGEWLPEAEQFETRTVVFTELVTNGG